MKVILAFIFLVTLVAGTEVKLREGITPQKLPAIELPQDDLAKIEWEMLRSFLTNQGEVRGGHVQADITNYTLSVLDNIQKLIVRQGFDPMELTDRKISLFPGSLTLSNGWLQELSTISVYDSVLATYSRDTKILEITLPLYFKSLLITYDYHTQIVLLSITGTIDAKISNVKLNLAMGFNFSSYHAFVDDINIKDSGSIDITFTGLGLLDWVINILDKFTYQYTTRVTLLSISGDVQGKIDNVSMDLQVTFDRDTKAFVLDKVNMKNSGKVTVKFTGNGLVDWLTNAMTSVVTTVLHPLIMTILQSSVRSMGNDVLNAVNEYINNDVGY